LTVGSCTVSESIGSASVFGLKLPAVSLKAGMGTTDAVANHSDGINCRIADELATKP